MIRRSVLTVALLAWSAVASAQQAPPTPDEFLGYELGSRFTPHHRILDYFQTLARQTNLVSVEQIGMTYEERPLVLAVITAPKNRSALASIRQNVNQLATASVDASRAAEIARTSPAVIWLAFGVHGNESSSAEAAMAVASTLVRDANSRQLLDDLVIVIDPLQNPDGRERYIRWFHQTRGMAPNPNPDSFEHNEPWPGGRWNHYLQDMNRDWSWLSQRETQARVAAYRQWTPQVFVDFHEMGYQSTYFFPPDAKPINANVPKEVERWLEVFGRANAEEFTRRGWQFFVAEHFDLFYPGYGDAWPSLNGAIGMTYEVAGHGKGGTSILRDDGTILTLADRVQRHYTTGMATLRTAAANREPLLLYSYNSARAQIDGGRNTFLIVPGSPNFEKLVDTLVRQEIKVNMLTAQLTLRASRIDTEAVENRVFPAGTVVVSTKQALGGLAQTLLERSPTFSKGFLEEQREKNQADQPDDFYDMTSWSLPLAMNVEAFVTASPVNAEMHPYAVPARTAFRTASYGYVIDGLDPQLYRAAGRMLRDSVRFSVSEGDLVVGDRTFARGSLVILKGSNGKEVDSRLDRLVRDTGVAITPVESGWTGGTSFGSERVRFVKDPKIALVGGPGTGPTSFGMIWHTLDVDTPIPHAVLSLDNVKSMDLEKYEVLILPDGDYADRLGKRGTERLQQWVRNGGTLVAVKGASSYLRSKDVELSKIKPWEPPKKKDADEKTPAEVEERYNDFRVPGSAFKTVSNNRSYLTFGVPRSPAVMIEGSTSLLPVTKKIDNVVTIEAKNALVSGVAWPESIERLQGSAYLVNEPVGKGAVITFADEPHYRLFWRGTLPLFLNAVLYSASFRD